MSLDDTVNLERIATALGRLATAFEQYNIICRERLRHEFPAEKPKLAPEVITTQGERREQYSDVADERWLRQTEAALPPETASRFQKRFDETEHPAPAPRRKRTVAVPEVH